MVSAWELAVKETSFGDLGNGFYLNPIYPGDYPDPTILRDGADYYLTHTPHDNKPGLIDPGHIVGEDGHRYLYFSDGHMIRLAPDGPSTVGEARKAYDGRAYPEDWLVECFCLESPKLFLRGEYFYLVSAQGGTSGPAPRRSSGILSIERNNSGPRI